MFDKREKFELTIIPNIDIILNDDIEGGELNI